MRYILPTIFILSACTPLPIPTLNDPNGYMQTAASYMFYTEYNNRKELRKFLNVDPTNTEWCAAFINSTLHTHGFEGSESVSEFPLLARSFVDYGIPVITPEVGDIVILSRGADWQGHVGFYVSKIQKNGVTYYALLSGNNDDAVNIDWFPESRLVTIRRVTSANLLEYPVKNSLERTPTGQQSLPLVQAYLLQHSLPDS